MGRTGGKFLYCVPSDCKSDGTQGIPVLHFQGCLSNPQGATDGWQTDNLVSTTMPMCIIPNIVLTWTRRFHVSCKGKVQICLRPGMLTGKNLVCKRMLKKKRMPENRKEISFFV